MKMNKILVGAGANEAGAWKHYSDGSRIEWIVSLNQTIITDNWENDYAVTKLTGRQGI